MKTSARMTTTKAVLWKAATARSHHAGRGALVFRFEIALDQLLEEELIGFECLEHKEIS